MSKTTVAPVAVRTLREIIEAAMGDHIDALNWGDSDPGSFDQRVFVSADAVRRSLTTEEAELLADYVGFDGSQYYAALGALKDLPGGQNFATARLITAMYWRTETFGQEDLLSETDPFYTQSSDAP